MFLPKTKRFLIMTALFVFVFVFVLAVATDISGGEKSGKKTPRADNWPAPEDAAPPEIRRALADDAPRKEIRTPEQNTFLVTRVIDGDTIEIEGGRKVRYIGIDTPEIVDPRKPVECFGAEASKRNTELALGKKALLEKDISETDRYGRLLRYVYVDGVFVNLALVEEGFAYSSTLPPDVQYQNQFLAAERAARENRRGLWSSCPAPTQEQPVSAPAPTAQPSGACAIKGNISSAGKIYHLKGCGSYDETVINESQGERWFCSEEEALAAGWRKAKNCP